MGVGRNRLFISLLSVFIVLVMSGSIFIVGNDSYADLGDMEIVKDYRVAADTEWLSTNANTTDHTSIEWTFTGSEPWLDAQDEPTNFVSTKADEVTLGYFLFPSTTLTGSITMNITVYGKHDDGPTGEESFFHWGHNGSYYQTANFGFATTWGYKTITVSEIFTVTEINAMQGYFSTNKVAGADNIYLDHLRLGLSGAVGGNDYYAYPSASFALGGTTSLVASFSKTLSESFSLGGLTSLVASFSKTLVEGFTLAGTVDVSVIIQKLISDSFALTGDVALAASFVVTLINGFALAGVVALAGSYVLTLVEGFTLTGIVSAFKVLILTIQDSFIFGALTELDIEHITRSFLYELFLSRNMWGYLGPIALVIGGYVISQKDTNLGVLWFIVECLIVGQYLLLVSATPDYWWHIFLILIGGLLTCVYPIWGKK